MPFLFFRTFWFFSGEQLSSFTAARFPTLPLSGEGNDQVTNPEKLCVKPLDEDLLACLVKGDQEALGLLFQRYARVVRSVANRILRDATEADDLVQDLFLFIRRKPQGSLQNRPYGVTPKAAMGKFPELRCCTLPFAFWASLICEISRWRPISSSKVEKISLR